MKLQTKGFDLYLKSKMTNSVETQNLGSIKPWGRAGIFFARASLDCKSPTRNLSEPVMPMLRPFILCTPQLIFEILLVGTE